MKTIKLILFLLIPVILYGQENLTQLELMLFNFTGSDIEIQLYPISGVFNGNNKYTMIAAHREPNWPNEYDYINGVYYKTENNNCVKYYKSVILYSDYTEKGWQDDFTVSNGNAYGNIAFGNYKLIIKNLSSYRVDSCLIYYDYYEQNNNLSGELKVFIKSDVLNPRFYYKFSRNDPPLNQEVEINYSTIDGYTIRNWQPNGTYNNTNARPKNFGPVNGFELVDILPYNNIEHFPIDSRKDCYLVDLNPLFDFECEQNQSYPDEGFDERHAILPLNLTIKKKVSTPYSQTTGYPSNTVISVEPSVVLSIDKGLTDEPNGIWYGFFINQYMNSQNGNDLLLNSSISLDPDSLTTLRLLNGTGVNDNSRIYLRNNCKIISGERSLIDMGSYSQIILERLESLSSVKPKLNLKNNSKTVFGQSSQIVVNPYCELVNEGGIIEYKENSASNIVIKNNGLYEIFPNVTTNTHTVYNGGSITVQGGEVKIGDNSKLIFDGPNSFLQLETGSNINLGNNAKIEFKNGAYFIANGSNISSLPNKQGWGISLENAGEQTIITNCNFSNLTRALYIDNTDAGHANLLRNISNNTFTGNENCMMLLGTNNTNAIHIINNNFYMEPNKGFGVFMVFTAGGSGSEAAGASYNLYFQDNDFEDGNLSAAFLSETSSYPFITFKYNTFSGSSNHTNLYLRQITGDFKYNTIVNNSGFNVDITQSNPNILSNTMTSPNLNILNTAAYPVMAPVSNSSTDGGWIWKGGKNQITSSNNDNVSFDNGSILLDWGQNCFLKGANKYHLIGGIDEPTYEYKVRNNDFNNSNIPVSSLYYYYNINQQVTPYYQGSNFSCNSTDLGTVWLINDLGNGIYDTVFKSNNTSGYQPQPDEANYSSATVKMTQNQYFDAISYFKALINNYPSSSYTDACLYDLYECYLNLDTSGNQSIRDILFNDLRNYLNSKILSGLYSSEFNNIAYNVTVMCEAYIGDFNEALEGYEFISLYHPDMYIRLLASWDYAEILELLNGPGGISSKAENMTDEEYVSHVTKRLNKLIAEDPVKKKMKKSFLRMKEDRKIAVDKDILTKTKDEKATKTAIAKLRKDEQKMEDRVMKVLRYAGTMSEEEKRKQQMEDILLSRYNGNNSSDVSETKIPGSYELSQNYPNPFNPTTTIKYALPKDGFVTLKIYDITGREIKVLVNEFRQAGYYTVDFNGSSLASGVYFYRIQSGAFISVKKMVLIK